MLMRIARTLLFAVVSLSPGFAAAQAERAVPFVTRAGMTIAPYTSVPNPDALAPVLSAMPVERPEWVMPEMQWDDHPRGVEWSIAVMAALRSHGSGLMDVVPRDINEWCPGYPTADRAQRAAFWAGLISTLAFYESTHRQTAVGGGGLWYGLVQIAPGTARWRNCEVRSGQALLDGAANLRCGIRIMATTVPRDQVVSEGMEGVAADWGPFHSPRKRDAMQDWVSRQTYCLPRLRPEMRPGGLTPSALIPVERPMRFAWSEFPG